MATNSCQQQYDRQQPTDLTIRSGFVYPNFPTSLSSIYLYVCLHSFVFINNLVALTTILFNTFRFQQLSCSIRFDQLHCIVIIALSLQQFLFTTPAAV